MCAYFTQSDIERYTGFASTDFKSGGSTMSATEWSAFCSNIVDYVTQLVNRYCNVTSFEPHVVTEYRDGRGARGDKGAYLDEDKVYYLREYATGIEVYEDVGSGIANWVKRTERSGSTSGDYSVATVFELTAVRFHNNFPREGWKNVKFVYWGGYPEGSPQLNEIKNVCLDIAAEILKHKKKLQETTTIRATGVRDYAEMFKPDNDPVYLTEGIRQRLHKYRRYHLGWETWT